MGSQGVGKTTVLQLFVDYLEKQKIEKIEGGIPCKTEKIDFKGETQLVVEDGGISRTVTPNKVVFIETGNGTSHTIFAPGGDRDRAVVRMGVITISRIAKQIIAVFDVSQSIKEQFKLFDLIRYMPKTIYVSLNKHDLLEEKDKEKKLAKMKAEIDDYFSKRKIEIKSYFQTCAIQNEKFKQYNDNAARMILDISLGRV